jgi:hypothetical protein
MKRNTTKVPEALSLDVVCATKLEGAILAAYALGWRDRHDVGADVAAGSVEATAGDLATATPIGTEDLYLRIAGAR